MMKNIVNLFFILLFALFVELNCAALTGPEKVENFTRKYITNFINNDQIYNLTWSLTYDLILNKSKSEIGDDLVNNLTNSLTSNQYTKLAQYLVCLYPKFGSKDAIMATLNKVISVISKAVNSFYLQLATKILSMNTDGKGPRAKYLQVARMIAQYLTQKNVCTIMQAVKRNLTQTEWSNLRGCVDDDTVHWTNCGL